MQLLRMNAQSKIENPRKYDAQVIDDLTALLRKGSSAQPDIRRQNFYQVEGAAHGTFYVHISPVTGNAILIARWPGKTESDCCLEESCCAV